MLRTDPPGRAELSDLRTSSCCICDSPPSTPPASAASYFRQPPPFAFNGRGRGGQQRPFSFCPRIRARRGTRGGGQGLAIHGLTHWAGIRAMATFHHARFGAPSASAIDLPASFSAASNACCRRAHLISAISGADISGANAIRHGNQRTDPIGLSPRSTRRSRGTCAARIAALSRWSAWAGFPAVRPPAHDDHSRARVSSSTPRLLHHRARRSFVSVMRKMILAALAAAADPLLRRRLDGEAPCCTAVRLRVLAAASTAPPPAAIQSA